jgi:hypothetical protein
MEKGNTYNFSNSQSLCLFVLPEPDYNYALWIILSTVHMLHVPKIDLHANEFESASNAQTLKHHLRLCEVRESKNL